MNRLTKLITASACCLCMAVTQFAQAVPVGMKTIMKQACTPTFAPLPSPPFVTCNVFVQFNDPADILLSMGFSTITTNDPQGFFQSPFQSNTPVNTNLCLAAPGGFDQACCDSFVTIGCKTAACDQGATAPDGDFSAPLFNQGPGAMLVGGWFNNSPPNGHGNPDATLQVLVAQLTVHEGTTQLGGSTTAFFGIGTPFVTSFECFAPEEECTPGTMNDPLCDDGNPCTDDPCGLDGQCAPPVPNSNPCNDGLFCNGADTCGGGSCSLHAGDPCTGGAACNNLCNEAADNCFNPSGSACGNPADGGICDNPDTCNGAGSCQNNNAANGMVCESDGNQCTTDACQGGICVSTNVANGLACGSSANTDCDNPDSCSGGTCVNNGEADGTLCTPDANGCTDDVCSNRACVHPNSTAGTPCGSASNTDCDDPDTCNGSGSCNANNAGAGTPCGSNADTDCDNPDTCNATGGCQNNGENNGTACTDDNNDCTNDVCNNRQCTHPNAANGTSCDDGACPPATPCTCQGGSCVSCTVDADCDDGVDCTVDDCTPAGCTNTPDNAACDDDNVCTNDSCGAAGCEYTDNDGAGCDDGNPCTSGDTCSGGSCSGTPDCTSDGDCDVANGETCDVATGCCTGGVEYALDIREKKCPNKLKCNSNGTIKVYIVGDAANDVSLIDLDTIVICPCGSNDCISPDKPPRVKDKVGPHFTSCGDCSCAKLKKDYINDIEIKFKHLCDVLDPNLPEGALVDWEVRFDLNDGTDGTAHDCTIIDRPGSGQP